MKRTAKVPSIAVIVAAVFLTIISTSYVAQAQVVNRITNTYAAKFICGVHPDNGINDVPDAQPGRYSSKINVHNNTGVSITFRKKFIILREGEKATDPQTKVFEQLKEDQAMEVVCRDIYNQLGIHPNPSPPYIEGFVIIEVYFLSPSHPGPPPPDPLDVEGIYTYKGDQPGPGGGTTGSGVSIEVVVYPAKSNGHIMH
jgi:hypothetical protein